MICEVIKAKLKPLEGLLSLPGLVEISTMRSGEVALEMTRTGYEFKEMPDLTLDYWTKLCYVLGNKDGVVFDPVTQPRISTRLPGGHRFEAMVGKSVESGVSVSIRLNRKVPVSFEDFGVTKDLKEEIINAVEEGQAIIISGGTSSGKTTFLNLLIQHIPLHKRILTVEDTRELELAHRNSVSYIVSRNEKNPTIDWPQVIDHLMRSRPDIIVAGELSIANTFALISLLDTGHRGFMSTVHSNACHLALEETIPTKVHLSGRSIPGISDYLKKTVDWVIQIQKVQEGSSFQRRVVEVWQPQQNRFQALGQPKINLRLTQNEPKAFSPDKQEKKQNNPPTMQNIKEKTMFKILPLLCALTTITQASTDDSPLFEPTPRLKEEKIHVVERCVRSRETRIEPGFVSYFAYKPDDPIEARQGVQRGTQIANQSIFDWGKGFLSKHDCHDFSHHHLYNTFPGKGWLWRTDKEMERTKIFYVDLEISDYTFWTWTGFYKDHSVRAAYGAIPLAHNLLLKEVVGIIPSESFKRRRKILPHKSYLYPS